MKVVLELLDQPSNIRKITVRHDIVIGRGADCNLRLSAPQISRRHCFMRVGRESVSVTDLDSSNGTYLNGRRIESGRRYDIHDGVTLALGPIRFVVCVRSEKVAAEVLQVQTLNDSINFPNGVPGSTGSTVMEAEQQGQHSKLTPGFSYSIEQGGPSADEHEPTADMAETDPEDLVMDSEAEIVDLGRRIAQREAELQFAASDVKDDTDIPDDAADLDAEVEIVDEADLIDDDDDTV